MLHLRCLTGFWIRLWRRKDRFTYTITTRFFKYVKIIGFLKTIEIPVKDIYVAFFIPAIIVFCYFQFSFYYFFPAGLSWWLFLCTSWNTLQFLSKKVCKMPKKLILKFALLKLILEFKIEYLLKNFLHSAIINIFSIHCVVRQEIVSNFFRNIDSVAWLPIVT